MPASAARGRLALLSLPVLMRVSFWPSNAWKFVVGAPWPWVSPDDGGAEAFAGRIRSVLVPYWQQRLAGVEAGFLSTRMRERLASAYESIEPTQIGAAGYEKAVAATRDDATAFWFFELGAVAWIRLLEQMRRDAILPDDGVGVTLDEAVHAWRYQGPAAAAVVLDRLLTDVGAPTLVPTAALMRAPLALWQDRDPVRAMALLDAALTVLPLVARRTLGPTLPLTYGLGLALTGDLDRAIDILTPVAGTTRARTWSGMEHPEVRYHRARLLWDQQQAEPAIALLRGIVQEDASYAGRVLTDPAWREIATTAQFAAVATMLSELAMEARSALTRFQQTRSEAEGERPAVRALDEVLAFGGDEGLFLLAAGTLLPQIQEARAVAERLGPVFRADVARLQDFAGGLPTAFPLRIGPQYAPRFRGRDSDLTRLESLLAREEFSAAADFVGDLLRDLPGACRLGLGVYLQRLALALTSSADVLFATGKEEDRLRYETAVDLAERCVGVLEAIKQLGSEVGPDLLFQLQRTWGVIADIEARWVKSETHALGRMKLLLPSEPTTIARGGFTAIQVKVVDAAGQPVPGVPVQWQITSGAARARDAVEALDGEWAMSLATGVAYLPLEAPVPGAGGDVTVSLPGGFGASVIPYQIVAPRTQP